MQVIIFKNKDGGVSVCTPTGELPIEEVMEKHVPANSGARVVEDNSLPYEYDEFFNAWEMDETSVTVSLAKSKEITKARLRAQRAPLLQAQDVAFQRALESGVDTSAIIAEKQRLRDITKLADEATTLDELKELKV